MHVLLGQNFKFCQDKIFFLSYSRDASEKGGVEDRILKCLLSLELFIFKFYAVIWLAVYFIECSLFIRGGSAL